MDIFERFGITDPEQKQMLREAVEAYRVLGIPASLTSLLEFIVIGPSATEMAAKSEEIARHLGPRVYWRWRIGRAIRRLLRKIRSV